MNLKSELISVRKFVSKRNITKNKQNNYEEAVWVVALLRK
jgi:hypothetical protein